MKKLLTLIAIAVISLSVNAQKDVTTFLGIPVDGTNAEMIQKLKAKGFTSTSYDKDILEGEFNGRDVTIHVVTNGNKVYRIMVVDANTSNESDIKIRFNNLCRQFEKNGKYIPMDDNQLIPEDEQIGMQMSIYNKRYEAGYFQKPRWLTNPEKADTIYIQQEILQRLKLKYTQEQIENPTEEISKEMQEISQKFAFEMVEKKIVWFMISKETGLLSRGYNIYMYYDNEYNHADGEDL